MVKGITINHSNKALYSFALGGWAPSNDTPFQKQQIHFPKTNSKNPWNFCMFPQIGVPQIIHLNSVFHYKPSILEYPYFWKHSVGISPRLSNSVCQTALGDFQLLDCLASSPRVWLASFLTLKIPTFHLTILTHQCNLLHLSFARWFGMIWSWSTYPPLNVKSRLETRV